MGKRQDWFQVAYYAAGADHLVGQEWLDAGRLAARCPGRLHNLGACLRDIGLCFQAARVAPYMDRNDVRLSFDELDDETREMLEGLPELTYAEADLRGGVATNALVFRDSRNHVVIWPRTGGGLWLHRMDHIKGDCALYPD